MLPQAVENRFRSSEISAQLRPNIARSSSLAIFVGTLLLAVSTTGCSRVSTEPRKFLPADALVAISADNLGAALTPIIERAAGQAKTARKPDLSALNGMKFAAAITGFEARETPAGGEQAFLDLRPRLVAIIETNAWSWQVDSFVEDRLGELIDQAFGGELELESYPKSDGTYFVWTAPGGRRAFAFVVGSLVFLANDEAALEKALNVRSGSEPPLEFEVSGEESAAFRGLVTESGVGQIANFAAIQLAIGSGEEDQMRQFILTALPQATRNAVKEIYWLSRIDKNGVEDRYRFILAPKIAELLGETLTPGSGGFREIASMIPADVPSVTFYNVKDSRVGWRSILLAAKNSSDPLTATLLPVVAGSLFEPFGIKDAERFLAATRGPIATFRIDAEGERGAVTGLSGDVIAIRRSLAREIAAAKKSEALSGFTVLSSDENCFAFDRWGRYAVGDCEAIDKAIKAITSGSNLASANVSGQIGGQTGDPAAAITYSTRNINLSAMLFAAGNAEHEPQQVSERSITRTNFDRRGFIRITRSDFGIVGILLERIGERE